MHEKNWPTFQFDLGRTGHVSNDTGPKTNVKESWTAQTSGSFTSSPVVKNGLVYVGSTDGNVYAFDSSTGRQEWTCDTGQKVKSDLTVENSTVYVGNENGLCAIDANRGMLEWEFDSVVDKDRQYFRAAPAVVAGTVYVGDRNNNLYAINNRTGTAEWYIYKYGSSAPAIAANSLYINDGHGVYALDRNGAHGIPLRRDEYSDEHPEDPHWKFEDIGVSLHPSTPAVKGNTVYVGGGDGHLYAIDTTTGREKWHYETDDEIRSSPAIANGTVYVGSRDEHLYAIDAATGEKKWAFSADGRVDSSPAVADGVVYVASNEANSFTDVDGHLYAINTDTGELLWEYEIGYPSDSSPAISDGKVYISGGDTIYAIAEAPDATEHVCPACEADLTEYGDVDFCPECGTAITANGNSNTQIYDP
jgi:outer membrane protein assembly factor BamB